MNFQKEAKQHTKPVISPDCMLLRKNDFKKIIVKIREFWYKRYNKGIAIADTCYL